MNLKLSIITINFNHANGLEKTIESVIQQRFTNFEFILIDGGSTDESLSLLKKYKQYFSYSVSENDEGIYDAQNKGILKAKGEYCLFLNSGDTLYNSDVLSNVFNSNEKYDLIYGDVELCKDAKKIRTQYQPDSITPKFLFTESICHQSVFFMTQLFQKFGAYNVGYKIAADYDFLFRVITEKSTTQKHLPLIIANYDTTGLSSESKVFKELQKEREIIKKKYLPPDTYAYLEQLQKFKSEIITRWLMKNPRILNYFNLLYHFYSRIRN